MSYPSRVCSSVDMICAVKRSEEVNRTLVRAVWYNKAPISPTVLAQIRTPVERAFLIRTNSNQWIVEVFYHELAI